MMYITNERRQQITWHVGERIPPYAAIDVIEIQADGDELAFIRKYVTMANDSNRSVITWFGDDAKFIASNALKM